MQPAEASPPTPSLSLGRRLDSTYSGLESSRFFAANPINVAVKSNDGSSSEGAGEPGGIVGSMFLGVRPGTWRWTPGVAAIGAGGAGSLPVAGATTLGGYPASSSAAASARPRLLLRVVMAYGESSSRQRLEDVPRRREVSASSS